MSTLQAIAVGVRAAREATGQWRRDHQWQRDQSAARAGRIRSTIAEHALTVLGLACFTSAAALIAAPLALVVAGASFFVLELRLSAGGQSQQG